jgi:hypothetical protein
MFQQVEVVSTRSQVEGESLNNSLEGGQKGQLLCCVAETQRSLKITMCFAKTKAIFEDQCQKFIRN